MKVRAVVRATRAAVRAARARARARARRGKGGTSVASDASSSGANGRLEMPTRGRWPKAST